ncbi:hypothetical protein [Prevotella sp. HCN-7019]|uniref:hypothetical protein n=1 Tax=Prevotella sp. HCN-7019 TaxID=3134668 RepID=UPI0030BFE7FC
MKNKKNMIVIVNIIIQLLWYAITMAITNFVIKTWFNDFNKPWKYILGGIVFIVVITLITIITNIIKAKKDPDIQTASNLGIPINRYRKYKELYDEHQRLMLHYGIESKEANDYFSSSFKQIKYPNEWHKFQQSQYKSINNILKEK